MVTARTRSLRVTDQPEDNPFAGPSTVDTSTDNELAPGVTMDGGVLHVVHDDGSATVDFNPDMSSPEDKEAAKKHFANLAKVIEDSELGEIATTLLDGIERDETSRKEWLDTRARGITLLGLKLEEPKGDVGISSAPLEGMSTIRHPMLLEATVRFQATARGELLPSGGPVKVRNDTPTPPAPKAPGIGHNGGPPMGSAPPQPGSPDMPEMATPMAAPPPPQGPPPPAPVPATPAGAGNEIEELASALETDFNHYLTITATEYIPDTDRMLFYIGFGGDGFKKVYNCPLRRRPVSESVDAEDLIVSNAATDLKNCGRVTHKIKMRKSVLKRMQILGAYRDVDISPPMVAAPQNSVEQKKEEVSGIKTSAQDADDRDYTVFECYCELDLDEFAPKVFKGKGIPLPYRVTVEKDSKQVLSVIRNWEEDDEQALPKQFFVQFPFIRGLGFYGLGLIHLLGNTTATLTAAWREFIDAGMFASFPGFLHKKELGRQNTSNIRVGPGQGYGLDIGPMADIRQSIMPLPYKEPGAASVAFITHVEEVGQRLGQTADVQVGEGKQDAPVGTTLALIEQATKIIDSVHKRLHASQTEEFGLLKDRFKEDPEAFWRHNRRPAFPWEKAQFLKALDNCRLAPVADPNSATSLHRMAKAMAVKQLQQASPMLYDPVGVDTRIMRIIGIDPEGLFRPTPAPPPPDPRLVAIQAKAQAEAQTAQQAAKDSMIKLQIEFAKLQDNAKDRASKQQLEQMKIALEHVKLQQEAVIHAHQMQNEQAQAQQEMQLKSQQGAMDLHLNAIQGAHDIAVEHARNVAQLNAESLSRHHERIQDAQDHALKFATTASAHRQKTAHAEETHKQNLENQKEIGTAKAKAAAAMPKAKPASKSS
jgi:hypothetical protein